MPQADTFQTHWFDSHILVPFSIKGLRLALDW